MNISYYFIFFYIVWAIRELLFGGLIPDASVGSLLLKVILWIVPVYLYLKYVDKVPEPISYLKLKDNAFVGAKWGLIVSVVLVLLEGSITYGFHGHYHFALGWRWITTFLFAFPEEIVFRGFLLQKLSTKFHFNKANVIGSLLFVSIHFPIWITEGFIFPKYMINVLMVFVVGYGFGYLFKRTNSLWATIIVHSVYNLLIYLR